MVSPYKTRRLLVRNTWFIGLLTLLSGCNSDTTTTDIASDLAESPVIVRLVEVRTRPMEQTVNVLGTLQAMDRTFLSTQVSGRVKTLEVDVGKKVMAGEILAQVEPREYELRQAQVRAQLAQARARLGLPPQSLVEEGELEVDPEETTIVKESQARLDEAQKNLDRVQALRTESLVPDSELERSQAGYAVAFIRHLEAVQEVYERQAIYAQRRAEFAMASQLVLETSLRAPFDGVIQTRIANVGEFLSAGSPVLEIVRVNPLRLQLDIPERQAPLIHEDQAVRISVEGETTLHEGRVARISPALNAQARMLRIEAEFLNPGHLRPGAFVRAAIVVRSDIPTLSLPTQSITSFAGTEKAFLMLTNTAIERQVILGRQQGEWVEVLEGLDAGDFVILNPVGLRSGMAIREPTSASRSVTQSEPLEPRSESAIETH